MSLARGSLLAALTFALTQTLLRVQPAPAPHELVQWEEFAALGSPPYDSALLLDFSATWCVPCRHMKLTTFRDPAFASMIDRMGLRPVRVDEDVLGELEFSKVMARFGVAGIPALVVVSRDGWHYPAVLGETSTEEVFFSVSQGARRAEYGLRWTRPTDPVVETTDRPILRSFDKWFFVEHGNRTDWRWSKDERFVRWANGTFTLVEDQFASNVQGANYYRKHGVQTVPTIILEMPGAGEIARFVGAQEIETAPRAIASLLGQNGKLISPPPSDEIP